MLVAGINIQKQSMTKRVGRKLIIEWTPEFHMISLCFGFALWRPCQAVPAGAPFLQTIPQPF